MALFELQRLPGAPKSRGRIQPGTPLIRWLDGQKLHNNVVIKLNGRDLQDSFDLGYKVQSDDRVQVFDQPEGGSLLKTLLNPLDHLNPIKFAKKIMGSFTKSADTSGSYATGDSPNNDLTGQTNRSRLYKGRPNIYGAPRVFPDLIQEALYEYIDDNRYITEWFEVGYGRYVISSVRYSESNLGSLAGASYQIFQPGAVIGTIDVGYEFDDVDGEEVPGLNESDDYPSQTATTATPTSVAIANGELTCKVLSTDDNFAYFAGLALPHAVSFVVNATYTSAGAPVTKDVTGYGNIVATADAVGDDTLSYTTFIIGNITGGEVTTLPADAFINQTLFTLNDQTALVIGPSVSPTESAQLWVHVMVQLGATAGTSSYLIKFWKVDDENNQVPGTEESYPYTFDNDYQVTTKNYRTTHKYTPAAGVGRYAVTIERTDNSNDSNVVTLIAIHAVDTRESVVYPNDTIAKVTIKGSNDSNSNREQKYNLVAQRMVISYNQSTGEIDYTLRASRSFADAVLHEWLVVGKQDASRLDIAALYAISSSLSDPQLGYFDWTFSDASQSLGERIQTACNVARVNMNWVGDTLTFWRDEKVTYPDAVFARSNMFWDGYKIAYSMSLPGGYDGIALDYTDASTNTKAYIYLSVDENGITEVEDSTANANQISLSGSSNKTQAMDRAQMEAGKLLYSRMSMTVKVLETAQVVRGSVIQCPDMYDNAQQTGYITGRTGDVFSTSERLIFDDTMYVVVTDSQGNYKGRFFASPVDGNAKAFSADAGVFDLNIYDGVNVQVPSRYFMANESELNATIWRVDTATPNGDFTQTLSLTEYSNAIYQ